jgi:hypothetical protein
MPFFLDNRGAVTLVVVVLTFPETPIGVPRGGIDILLLVALPFRRLPRMLLFDSLDLPSMLSLGSLAVAPLRPVDVGDGCILLEEDRDGT